MCTCVYVRCCFCILTSIGTIVLKCIHCAGKICLYHSPTTGFLHFYNNPDCIFAVLLTTGKFPRGGTIKFLSSSSPICENFWIGSPAIVRWWVFSLPLQSWRRTTLCSSSSQSNWTCWSSFYTKSWGKVFTRSCPGSLTTEPSFTWSTDIRARWVDSTYMHYIKILNKMKANLSNPWWVFFWFVFMKSQSSGKTFFPRTLSHLVFPVSLPSMAIKSFIMKKKQQKKQGAEDKHLKLCDWHDRRATWGTARRPCSPCIRSMPSKRMDSWLWTCAAATMVRSSQTSRWRTCAENQERTQTR